MSDDALQDAQDALAYFYSLYRGVVNENLFNGIVFGLYIVAYVTSVYTLLSKPGFTSSPPRMFMFGITTFMFALGIVALALVNTSNLRLAKLMLDASLSDTSFIRYNYAWSTISSLMYILCDIICAWRAVVLWNKDKRIIAILVIFILGTIVSAGCAVAAFGNDEDLAVFANYSTPSVGKLDLIVAGPTLGTNLLSTGFIASKAWQRRIQVREHLSEGSGRKSVRVDRCFALLIESGLIYCCIWVYYCIAKFGLLPDPGFTIMAFVSGLYPTLIIILVSKQMSPVEHYSTHSTDMQFVLAPALGPPRDGGVTQHMLTICPDSTSDSDSDTRLKIPSTIFMKPSDEEGNVLY